MYRRMARGLRGLFAMRRRGGEVGGSFVWMWVGDWGLAVGLNWMGMGMGIGKRGCR